MSDRPQPQEVPINRWPLNQRALHWLRQAKEPGNPQMPYVVQLAQWGLEAEQVQMPDPLAPSQPLPEGVAQLVGYLQVTGAKPAHQAMQYLLSNPNLDREEQQNNLETALQQATTPQAAAAAVLEIIYDLMVATSE